MQLVTAQHRGRAVLSSPVCVELRSRRHEVQHDRSAQVARAHGSLVWDAQTRLSEILAPAEAHAESWTDISILHDMSRVNSE